MHEHRPYYVIAPIDDALGAYPAIERAYREPGQDQPRRWPLDDTQVAQVLACAERLGDGYLVWKWESSHREIGSWSLISPGSAELLRQGDERGRQGDYPQAIALAERALWSGANGREHERVLADFQISTSLILLGRGVEARARVARTTQPDHPSGRLAFHQCKAWIHAALGDRDEVKAEMAASIHAFHQAEEERAWPDGPYGDPRDAFAVDPVFQRYRCEPWFRAMRSKPWPDWTIVRWWKELWRRED